MNETTRIPSVPPVPDALRARLSAVEAGFTESSERHVAFDKVCVASREIFVEKNRQYGDAIATTGVLGATVELIGITARLRQLVIHDPTHGAANRDALINVFKDAHNYANIGLMMLAEDNWDGK